MVELEFGRGFLADADKLLTARTCVIAQSGGGKSYGIGVICEELLKKNLGFAIIDPEGEYVGLKEKFDALWVGADAKADLNITRVDFKKLCKVCVKNSFSIILDTSDAKDEKGIVEKFVSALFLASEEQRKPYLLIIEEVDKFAPNKGKQVQAIEEVARRGRKRGLGLLIATQRPSFVSKNVLSQCNNQLLGKLTIKNDIDAVNIFFANIKEAKELVRLDLEFVALGEFVGKKKVVKFKQRVTSPGGFTPKVKSFRTKKLGDVLVALETAAEEISEPEVMEKKETEGKTITGNEFETTSKIVPKDKILDALERIKKKKFGLFGEKVENTESCELALMPLYFTSVRIKKKGLVGEKILDLTIVVSANNARLVEFRNKQARFKQDLSKFFGLANKDFKVLKRLSKGEFTISDLAGKLDTGEESVRASIEKLKEKKMITEVGKAGRANIYASILKKHPAWNIENYTTLLSFEKSKVKGEKVRVLEKKVEENELHAFFKMLEPSAETQRVEVLYFPYYEAKLASAKKQRVIKFRAKNGKLLKL